VTWRACDDEICVGLSWGTGVLLQGAMEGKIKCWDKALESVYIF
jgi:hypothetical protein